MSHPAPTRRVTHHPDLAGKPRTPRPAPQEAPARPPRPEPTVAGMTVSVLSSAAKWIAAGCPKTSPDGLVARQAGCQVCPHWDSAGWKGRGRCRLCGCSGVKLGWATETCPDNPPRWGPEVPQAT